MVNSCHLHTTLALSTCTLPAWSWHLYCSFGLILWYNHCSSFQQTEAHSWMLQCVFVHFSELFSKAIIEIQTSVSAIACNVKKKLLKIQNSQANGRLILLSVLRIASGFINIQAPLDWNRAQHAESAKLWLQHNVRKNQRKCSDMSTLRPFFFYMTDIPVRA